MNLELLPQIESPADLRAFNDKELLQIADEVRQSLISVVQDRTAHFASNLGVVELCLALHLVYDFSKDRLIWDTGHQIYPHKLVTGRFDEFPSIRQRGGLMGYPNPAESEYDLFMTGHAGASVSTVLGLKAADDLQQTGAKAVAVIGDGALPSGMVFEAIHNAVGLNKDILIILNDNKMGICPRVGGLAKYLDRARVASFYNGIKRDISWLLNKVPLVGESVEHALAQFKEGLKTVLHGGTLFESLGVRYVGPVDGHDLFSLREYLEMVHSVEGPVLLHVLTEKGHGFQPACEDPVRFHTPPPFDYNATDQTVSVRSGGSRAYTNVVAESVEDVMATNEKVTVLTAAMCAGNKLGKVRERFGDRFFDTGICESHAVAFAAGMAKSGLRPIVSIYSTFLQRSIDQIFQEVALQNLPVTFCLDRAGLCGPDGPTHHGVFDNTYMRMFPNMVVMAPGDELDVRPMLDFALKHSSPTSLRYPKAGVETVDRDVAPIALGQAEEFSSGRDAMFIAFGSLFPKCVAAAEKLAAMDLDVGVINARFAKPLDEETINRAIRGTGAVITVEESTVCGGFGSAVLESANRAGLNTEHVRCLGIPDEFVEHGERADLLANLGLDVSGLVATARTAIHGTNFKPLRSKVPGRAV